jgi:parallel beta-helix repeat protein
MKKSASIVLILISLMALSTISTQSAKAQAQSIFIINSDGSVSPQTSLIQQAGSIYYLTSEVDTSVVFVVQDSNIVFDGNGHTVSNGFIAIGRSPSSVVSVTNLTVRNFNIADAVGGVVDMADSSNITIANNNITGGASLIAEFEGINVENSSSIRIIGNSIKNAWCGIWLSGSQDDLISENTISTSISNSWGNYGAAIIFNSSSNCTIYDNAFLNIGHQTEMNATSINTWDNGEVGNFWNDYLSRYPNATEIDDSGIGNTPYVIDANNVDHYPLMRLWGYSVSVPSPTLTSTPTPIRTTLKTPTAPETTHTPVSTEIGITMLSLVVIAFLLAVIIALLLYMRERNRLNGFDKKVFLLRAS